MLFFPVFFAILVTSSLVIGIIALVNATNIKSETIPQVLSNKVLVNSSANGFVVNPNPALGSKDLTVSNPVGTTVFNVGQTGVGVSHMFALIPNTFPLSRPMAVTTTNCLVTFDAVSTDTAGTFTLSVLTAVIGQTLEFVVRLTTPFPSSTYSIVLSPREPIIVPTPGVLPPPV